MRIKVLDVLSFVLLINRQFYEVCVHSGQARGVGGQGGAGSGLHPLWALVSLQQRVHLGSYWLPLTACLQLAFFFLYIQ